MIRPAELTAIKDGTLDLAFRRWDRPRVKVGTRMRTGVGVVEVTSVERVPLSALRADDARRAGAPSVTALRQALAHRTDRPVWRVGLRYAGADPREALRQQLPDADEVVRIRARLDRLDAASRHGPWTRASLELIDRNPGVRAPDLAARARPRDPGLEDRRPQAQGARADRVAGDRLPPLPARRGGPRPRRPRRASGRHARPGTPLPRTIGAPATGALRVQGVTSLEQVTAWTAAELLALHGVGPVAVDRLGVALAERGLGFREA